MIESIDDVISFIIDSELNPNPKKTAEANCMKAEIKYNPENLNTFATLLADPEIYERKIQFISISSGLIKL